MKTYFLCILLACAALAVLPAPGGADSETTCHYASNGLVGQLTIIGGEGLPYRATDSSGVVVGGGVVTASYYAVPVLGAASGPLRVRVGDEVLLADSRDGQWE